MNKLETIYEAVLITGPKEGIKKVRRGLAKAGYKTSSTRSKYEVLVRDIFSDELENIKEVSALVGCSVEGAYGEQVGTTEQIFRLQKSASSPVETGKWYFAENAEEVFPLVLVRDMVTERVGSEDTNIVEETQVYTLELLGPEDGLPYQVKMGSDTLAKWGLRPATDEDFFELDIIPPEVGELVKTEAGAQAGAKTAAIEVTAAPRNGFDGTLGRLRNRQETIDRILKSVIN